MSNSIHIHLEGYDRIEVCENLECDKECTPISLGDDVTIFASYEHLKELFEELDKKLHKETYSDLEDIIFDLSDNLEVANEALTILREIARGE